MVILGKASIESVIYNDVWLQWLVDTGCSGRFRVSHGDNEFACDGRRHSNGIESFVVLPKGDLRSLMCIYRL